MLTCRTLLPTIVAVYLLILSVLTPPLLTSGLPITSKPIENTVENLAWQAWLMLPQEQKNLEKSRKVTPKSIFTLPNRECPPGHQLYETRCIPMVNIDQEALLTQQLLGIIVNNGDAENNYEYDYDDTEVVVYDAPQKLSGEAGLNKESNYDDPSQLPSKDEPLKFNIFEQKFPTDYEADYPANKGTRVDVNGESDGGSGAGSVSSGGMHVNLGEEMKWPSSSADAMLNGTQFLEAVNTYLLRHANLSEGSRHNATTVDSLKINSNNSSSSSNTTSTITNSTDLATESSNLSFSILRNGPSRVASTATSPSPGRPFSISNIDAIALTAGAARPAAPHAVALEPSQKIQKFSLFKDDSAVQLVTTVMSDRNYIHDNAAQPDISQLLKAEALLPLFNMTHDAVNKNAASTAVPPTETIETTFKAKQDEDANASEITLANGAEGTTESAMLSELLEAAESIEKAEPEKEERTRSISALDSSEKRVKTAASTSEPMTTTNMQVDETTIFEALDPPAIALQELQRLRKQNEREHHQVLKKSKVEPVALDKSMTPLPTIAMTPTMLYAGDDVSAEYDDDRFYSHQADDEQRSVVRNGAKYDGFLTDSDTEDTGGSGHSPESDINIERELSIINELVKGNPQPQAAAAASSAFTESSFTTEARKTKSTATTSASENNSKPSTLPIDLVGNQENRPKMGSEPAESDINSETQTTAATQPVAGPAWSSIMPILSPSASPNPVSAALETKDSPSSTEKEATAVPSTASSSISISSNRSNRNSKILRMSYADSSSERANVVATTQAGTDDVTAATEVGVESTSAASTFEPFWWLPKGWRLDGGDDQVGGTESRRDSDEPSLLMRLWSALPGNQAKV